MEEDYAFPYTQAPSLSYLTEPVFEMEPFTISSPPLVRPQCAKDWEVRKHLIAQLYESHGTKDIERIMVEEHGFKATENQYKKQIHKWGMSNKRVKDSEYKVMIRMKREREEAHPGKRTAFQLRGVDVDDAKIERFQKRKKIADNDPLDNYPTPCGLTCFTPSPPPHSPLLPVLCYTPLNPPSPTLNRLSPPTSSYPFPSWSPSPTSWQDPLAYSPFASPPPAPASTPEITDPFLSMLLAVDHIALRRPIAETMLDLIYKCDVCHNSHSLIRGEDLFASGEDVAQTLYEFTIKLSDALHRYTFQSPSLQSGILSVDLSGIVLGHASLSVNKIALCEGEYQELQKVLGLMRELIEAGSGGCEGTMFDLTYCLNVVKSLATEEEEEACLAVHVAAMKGMRGIVSVFHFIFGIIEMAEAMGAGSQESVGGGR